MREPEIIVIGSTMVDMITYSDRVPSAGETVIGNAFRVGFGGKGANQAIMASLLGAHVSMTGCVGDDDFGRSATVNFSENGVDTRSLRLLANYPTGCAPIWVEPDGQNRIIVVPGANRGVDAALVDEALRLRPKPDVVVCQLEIPAATVEHALREARHRNVTTIFNPAPWSEAARPIASLATWVITNESEFAALCGLPEAGLESVAPSAFERYSGEMNLVVTLGEHGSVVCEQGLPRVHVPGLAVQAVDTTGAGDAFVGAFAYAIALGRGPLVAARFANACAAASVGARGTQSSFPRGSQVTALKTLLA